MAETADLGPLTLMHEGLDYRFVLSAPEQISLEIPPQYDSHIAGRLGEILPSDTEISCVMDLQGLPAISSRQLGLMLALHKALRGRVPRLPLTGVSRGVERLLDLTRTAQFFEIA